MNKILMISWYFPPTGGAGVQRTLKYVKYLPGNGWQPVVLTSGATVKNAKDATLVKEIPPGVPVYRAGAWQVPSFLPWRIRNFISRWFLIVDEQIGWLPPALARGKQIIRQDHPDIIYSTSAPYSAHLVGLRLQHTTGLPWVADFRDPWIGNFDLSCPTPLHFRIHAHLEKTVVQTASRIIVVSEPIRAAFLKRYPSMPPRKVLTIPNGYDGADFPEPIPEPSNQKFTITHSGTIYKRNRSAKPFLAAIKAGIASGQLPQDKILIRFIGNAGPAQTDAIELGLGSIVEFPGYVEHHQSISCLVESDLLLLIIGSGPGSDGVMTGKIYEYLAARRPILAMVPPGPAADLITASGAGEITSPDDPAEICTRVVSAYRRWQNGNLTIHPVRQVIEQFDRKNLAARLAAVLNELKSERNETHAR